MRVVNAPVIRRGYPWTIAVRVDPLNLVKSEGVRADFRVDPATPSPLVVCSTTNGKIIILEPTVFHIQLLGTDTALMAAGSTVCADVIRGVTPLELRIAAPVIQPITRPT